METVFDIIIIGGGIAGAAAAENLARRGQLVLLLEQFAPGHDRGSSHGDGRIIRFAYGDPIYISLSQLAYPAWRALSERAGEPLLQISGGWDCGPADSPYLAELEANFTAFDIPYERLTAAQSNTRFPQFRLAKESEAIYQPDGGALFADRAVLALWRLAAAAGATTVAGQRVTEINISGDRVNLVTDSATTWRGRRLIIAAGAWSKQLLSQLGLDLPLTITQEQVAYFRPADPAARANHHLGRMPIFVDWHTAAPFYGLPQIEIDGVKVGGHHTGREIDPDHRLPEDDDQLAALQTFVRSRLPHLDPNPILRLSCLYTNTPDEHFILDRHPTFPNVLIGTGFSGHGFKFGPALGQILGDLALDETPPLALEQFAVSRFEREA